MKKPRLDLGPKLNSAIAQPQMMITSGVRQVVAAGNGRESPAVAVMKSLAGWHWIGEADRTSWRELMHLHANPNRFVGQTRRRKAALRFWAGSRDDLTVRPPSGAQGGMLYVICSI